MKLYTFPEAPSPRRVHLFLAEKGLEIEQELVDMRQGEHMSDAFAAIHSDCTLPVLELDDGACLSSCAAICRHLESVQPEPPLLGTTTEQRARIDDRDRWVEMNGMLAVMEGFRNSLKGFEDHALPGRRPVAQIGELAERGRRRFEWFLHDLDDMLSKHDYVAGDEFSVADITALVTIDFRLARYEDAAARGGEIPAGLERARQRATGGKRLVNPGCRPIHSSAGMASGSGSNRSSRKKADSSDRPDSPALR